MLLITDTCIHVYILIIVLKPWLRECARANIKNTLIYTQLIEFGAEEEYHVKVARTLKEACKLAEAGFEYFTEIDGAQVFRKRR